MSGARRVGGRRGASTASPPMTAFDLFNNVLYVFLGIAALVIFGVLAWYSLKKGPEDD